MNNQLDYLRNKKLTYYAILGKGFITTMDIIVHKNSETLTCLLP